MMMADCDYSMGGMEGAINSISSSETRTNLIINYLPQNLTDQEFYKIFVVVGPIKNCRIMKDLKTTRDSDGGQGPNASTGYSFGFGFVEYQKPEDAAKAILQLNNLPVQHKRIKVSYARPPGEDIKETNLYIQNIPRSYTLDQLEDMFSSFGQIVQKNLLKDKVTGLPRGVGFVRYDKKSEAELAIEQMNGIVPDGGNEPLVVKVAEEHGKMKAAYYAGYHAGLQINRGGRGRGNFNGRGAVSFNRGNYTNTGKMSSDRNSTNRYHPLGPGNFNGAEDYSEDVVGDFSKDYKGFSSPMRGGYRGGAGAGGSGGGYNGGTRGGDFYGGPSYGRGGYQQNPYSFTRY